MTLAACVCSPLSVLSPPLLFCWVPTISLVLLRILSCQNKNIPFSVTLACCDRLCFCKAARDSPVGKRHYINKVALNWYLDSFPVSCTSTDRCAEGHGRNGLSCWQPAGEVHRRHADRPSSRKISPWDTYDRRFTRRLTICEHWLSKAPTTFLNEPSGHDSGSKHSSALWYIRKSLLCWFVVHHQSWWYVKIS